MASPTSFVTGSFSADGAGHFVPHPSQMDVDSGLPEETIDAPSSRTFVAGSFSADGAGYFIPHPSQVDVDSGLPEETLLNVDSGLPEETLDAASSYAPSERDNEDDYSDNSESIITTEGSWLSRSWSDRSTGEEWYNVDEEGDNQALQDYSDEELGDVDSSLYSSITSSVTSVTPSLLSSKNSSASESSSALSSEDQWNNRLREPVIRRALSLNNLRMHTPRRPQSHDPNNLEVHSNNGDGGNDGGNPPPRLPLWPAAGPTTRLPTIPDYTTICPHHLRMLNTALRRIRNASPAAAAPATATVTASPPPTGVGQEILSRDARRLVERRRFAECAFEAIDEVDAMVERWRRGVAAGYRRGDPSANLASTRAWVEGVRVAMEGSKEGEEQTEGAVEVDDGGVRGESESQSQGGYESEVNSLLRVQPDVD